MAALVAGEVTVSDAGVVSYDPAGAENSVAGAIYSAEIAASDAYTVANGGEVPADADRVPLLRWYAARSTAVAANLVAYLNANL